MPGLCLRKLRSPDQPWGKRENPAQSHQSRERSRRWISSWERRTRRIGGLRLFGPRDGGCLWQVQALHATAYMARAHPGTWTICKTSRPRPGPVRPSSVPTGGKYALAKFGKGPCPQAGMPRWRHTRAAAPPRRPMDAGRWADQGHGVGAQDAHHGVVGVADARRAVGERFHRRLGNARQDLVARGPHALFAEPGGPRILASNQHVPGTVAFPTWREMEIPPWRSNL
jgi:hypothetical protein